ncbi:hypothetical protein PENTCL1PPCAC_25783, partial [Pristionchus entomophagus]
ASPCSATRRYCGVRTIATRVCTPTGTCSGPAQQYEECGTKMCQFPSKFGLESCVGYIKGLLSTGGFECVPNPNIGAKKQLI